jgi:Fur family ferric uptake transcriptional regulator
VITVLIIGVCFMTVSMPQGQPAFGSGRMTTQRATIIDAADLMGCAFSVDDLAVAVRAHDASLGLATVYRAVSAMEASGWLERVGERSGSALYARCPAAGHHHHHLICTGCGRLEPANCPLGTVADDVATASGFVLTGHDVTLYGLCPDCASSGEG